MNIIWKQKWAYNWIVTFCPITTCNERCINRVHLTFSLYTNCQNRPFGKEFNTTAFVNLLICNVNVNIIINAMRSCNERTTLHCVESYLYYIILVNKKKYFLSSETKEKINRQYVYIHCRKYKIYIYKNVALIEYT
jgi:hypothetical protein